jgi:hypothetical protein
MARRRDYTTIQPGSDPTQNVRDIYENRPAHGHPRNTEPRHRRDPAVNDHVKRQGRVDGTEKDAVFNENTNQHPANWHDKNYNNDSGGWVRGCREGQPQMHSESGEHKPFFDKGNAWRTDRQSGMADQIKDYSDADHNRHHTEFERKHNAGMTHDPMVHDEGKRRVPGYERRLEYGLDQPDSNPKPRDAGHGETRGRHGHTDVRGERDSGDRHIPIYKRR